MSKNSLELKDFVNDPTFIENMNRAFSDLRADYELSMDSTCEKINELKSLHVDVKNHLSDLTSWSRNSSGVISGLRGTGKTHLFMLARSALNSTLWDAEKSHNLCIYLNLKRLCLPEQFDSDLFNRIFSVFIYNEVSKQLLQILSGLSEENKLKQFLSIFNTQKRKVKENLEKAILSLYEIKQIAYNGNERFSELSTGSLETESYDHLLASMGNTRDFGTMLLKCWSEFQSYRNSPLVQGRPFKYISLQMVTSAIKDNGDKKISNLNSNENTLSVWNDILNFCLSKKSSHFAINESQTELECLRKQEFSDLIYHRLLHFRKAHVPTKDGGLTDKLSIYAINYACSYNLHSESKISFITEYKTIHDRVRRYIYHPSAILQKLQIKEGEIFPCSNCGEPINILKMKAAWDNNACPFCGQHIRH